MERAAELAVASLRDVARQLAALVGGTAQRLGAAGAHAAVVQ
jgi:hypothetical protein